jgi:hypothetical protein
MWFQPIQKIFPGKNGLDSPILRKKFKLLDFYNKFQLVAKNIEGSYFFCINIWNVAKIG